MSGTADLLQASERRAGAAKRDVAQGGGACQRPVGPIGWASALLTLLLSFASFKAC